MQCQQPPVYKNRWFHKDRTILLIAQGFHSPIAENASNFFPQLVQFNFIAVWMLQRTNDDKDWTGKQQVRFRRLACFIS